MLVLRFPRQRGGGEGREDWQDPGYLQSPEAGLPPGLTPNRAAPEKRADLEARRLISRLRRARGIGSRHRPVFLSLGPAGTGSLSKASLASVAERVAFGGRTASADCVAESAVPLRLRRTTPRRFDWAAAGREVPGACLGQTQDFGFVWQRVHALCSGAWTWTLAASRSWAEAATLASSEPVRAISWRSVRIRLHEYVVTVTG